MNFQAGGQYLPNCFVKFLRSSHKFHCDPVAACGGVGIFMHNITETRDIFSQLAFHDFLLSSQEDFLGIAL